MRGAMVIFIAMVAIGFILYIFELRHKRKEKQKAAEAEADKKVEEYAMNEAAKVGEGENAQETEEGEECCGMHLVCDKETLSPLSADIEYYDDEELDRFIGRDGDDYTPEEVEEFRDVLMTLRGLDIPGWARSITARRINLPSDIRDELLILVNEQRENRDK